MREFEQIERAELEAMVLDCAEVFRADPPSDRIMDLWWDALGHLDAFFLRKSFRNHIKAGRFIPTIAEIGSGVWHEPQWILEDTTWARGILAGESIDRSDSKFDSARATVEGAAA